MPEKTEDVDRVDTPDSGNAPDTLCSSVADDSLSQVVKEISYILYISGSGTGVSAASVWSG